MTWWAWARRSPARGRHTGSGAAQPTSGGETDRSSNDRIALLIDDLTGLGNRFDLKDRLDHEVVSAPPTGPRPALLVLDIDDFKEINDAYGPTTGDEVLRAIGNRLVSQVSPHETVYRVGSDQFAVLADRSTPEDAVAFAGVLLRSVSAPIGVAGISLYLTASIGVVMLGHRDRSDAVLRDADLTMHRAKAEGGNRVDIYSGELDYWALSRKRDLDGLIREVEELRLENQALREEVMIDPLSELPNAAAFDADHLQAHARRIRSEEPYAIVLADIDYFRDYSERVGAAMANQTLHRVAQTIKASIRLGDRAYRYGWQEFMVLLPGAGLRDAVVAAERVRSKIEELGVEHPAIPSGLLTVTMGVIEAGFRHPTTKDVVAEVSDLLLEGKQFGRNQIVWPH